MKISRIGMQPEKNIQLVVRWARFAAVTNPLFPDYIPQRMSGMAAYRIIDVPKCRNFNEGDWLRKLKHCTFMRSISLNLT